MISVLILAVPIVLILCYLDIDAFIKIFNDKNNLTVSEESEKNISDIEVLNAIELLNKKHI